MTTLELLRAARTRIEQPDKWGQRRADGTWTGTCVNNAIFFSTPSGVDYYPATGVLKRVVGVSDLQDLFDWNDAPGRTHAEVLALYDRAIAIEEAKAQEFSVLPREEVVRVA